MELFLKHLFIGDTAGDISFPEGISCCHRDPEQVRCPVCGESTACYLPGVPWETINGKWCRADFCLGHNVFSLDGTEFEMTQAERDFRVITMPTAATKDHVRWMLHAYLVGAGVGVSEAWDMVDGYGLYKC